MPEDWTGIRCARTTPCRFAKTAEAWEPLQLSVEEFAAHVRAERSRAGAAAEESRPPA